MRNFIEELAEEHMRRAAERFESVAATEEILGKIGKRIYDSKFPFAIKTRLLRFVFAMRGIEIVRDLRTGECCIVVGGDKMRVKYVPMGKVLGQSRDKYGYVVPVEKSSPTPSTDSSPSCQASKNKK